MKRVPFDSQVPSDASRIEMKIFSQIHSRFQHSGLFDFALVSVGEKKFS